MKRYNRGVSPQGNGNCDAGSEAGMSYEFIHRAHRTSTEGRKMGGSVGVWGTPCSIQRGLARRLCILLVCTDPLSALAPKLQERWPTMPLHSGGPSLESPFRNVRSWSTPAENANLFAHIKPRQLRVEIAYIQGLRKSNDEEKKKMEGLSEDSTIGQPPF